MGLTSDNHARCWREMGATVPSGLPVMSSSKTVFQTSSKLGDIRFRSPFIDFERGIHAGGTNMVPNAWCPQDRTACDLHFHSLVHRCEQRVFSPVSRPWCEPISLGEVLRTSVAKCLHGYADTCSILAYPGRVGVMVRGITLTTLSACGQGVEHRYLACQSSGLSACRTFRHSLLRF